MIIENLSQNTFKDKIQNGSTRLKPKVKTESWVICIFFLSRNCTDLYNKTHAAELLSGEKVNTAGFPIYKDQALIELGIGDHTENLISS